MHLLKEIRNWRPFHLKKMNKHSCIEVKLVYYKLNILKVYNLIVLTSPYEVVTERKTMPLHCVHSCLVPVCNLTFHTFNSSPSSGNQFACVQFYMSGIVHCEFFVFIIYFGLILLGLTFVNILKFIHFLSISIVHFVLFLSRIPLYRFVHSFTR